MILLFPLASLVQPTQLLNLASILHGDKESPPKSFINELRGCLLKGVINPSNSTTDENGVLFNLDALSIRSAVSVNFDNIENCPLAFNGILQFAMEAAAGSRMRKLPSEKLDEVAFQMIGDDYNDTKSQLDSVRARRPKFICINDNMNDPSNELIQLLQDFFESFFPNPR